MKREAILYDRLDKGAVRCHVCQWECRIANGKLGVCRTRLNDKETLYTLIYGVASSVNVDPIEKKPLFHFHPASRVFSLGTWGCNFHCKHCQNWQISYARPSGSGWMDAEPEIAEIRPTYYVVNEDGDQPEKREFCNAHGLEYIVLQRRPHGDLPRRSSTDLRGF